ncbi:HlyD family efflux transporter periplasmic adaptor subunit [Moorena producens JHB]|uniref:HlyD family efflux transporter periplasmic adaptor subunit n=1 Tax=Moorena producens (strain JHB) TaxID=1454205 RepID=A0A1D9G052_MOOP1|nr:HlyD family efflux transporter periplasmic adaptor subunit [Moorena producens]AOY80884.1 HlyD family efflux transporter periplasmic adaptor subunit [Moorena producens JHB]
MPENHTLNGHSPTHTIPDQGRYEELLTQETTPQPRNDQRLQGHEWSYATKELLDTLPQVWTRGLLYFLIVFIGIALPWAIFAQVDETGKARGRLEPTGETIKLDAPVAGTVAAIKVKEGELVTAGQTLLELESELVSTELQQEQKKLEGQQNRLNQLEVLKNQLILALRTQEQQNQAQELEKQAQVEQARQNLEAFKFAYSLQKEELLAQIEQARQAIDSSKVAYELETIRLESAQEKIPRYQNAYKEGVLSKERFLDVEQSAKEAEKNIIRTELEIKQAQSRLKEQQGTYQKTIHQASADIKQSRLRLQEQERSYKTLVHSGKLALLKSEEQLKNIETQITTLKAEASQTKSQIKSLEIQLKQRMLAAPIEGIVFQSPIKSAGAVVQPGDTIVEIAPKESFLSLRAQIAISESGSLREGMAVKMKFDAYPFQDYGVVEGKVIKISPTSKVTETEQGKVPTYDLEIKLNKTCMPTPKECIALRPGDTATAEVIVRQRRIMDLVLDPFKKLQQGGLEL